MTISYDITSNASSSWGLCYVCSSLLIGRVPLLPLSTLCCRQLRCGVAPLCIRSDIVGKTAAEGLGRVRAALKLPSLCRLEAMQVPVQLVHKGQDPFKTRSKGTESFGERESAEKCHEALWWKKWSHSETCPIWRPPCLSQGLASLEAWNESVMWCVFCRSLRGRYQKNRLTGAMIEDMGSMEDCTDQISRMFGKRWEMDGNGISNQPNGFCLKMFKGFLPVSGNTCLYQQKKPVFLDTWIPLHLLSFLPIWWMLCSRSCSIFHSSIFMWSFGGFPK